MAIDRFSQRLFDLIDEDDRLIGLAEAVDVKLIEDPVNNQWVFSLAPLPDYPLPFTPSTQYGVEVGELDSAIRSAWGMVAQLAKESTQQALEETLSDLTLLVPRSPKETPSFREWIPTADPTVYESVRTVTLWDINQTRISPSIHAFQLAVKPNGFSIISPAGNKTILKRSAKKYPSANKSIYPHRTFEEKRLAELEERRNRRIERLSETQYQAFNRYTRQVKAIAFLDGFTVFTGVVAFLIGFVGSNMVIPIAGPIIFTIVVWYLYQVF